MKTEIEIIERLKKAETQYGVSLKDIGEITKCSSDILELYRTLKIAICLLITGEIYEAAEINHVIHEGGAINDDSLSVDPTNTYVALELVDILLNLDRCTFVPEYADIEDKNPELLEDTDYITLVSAVYTLDALFGVLAAGSIVDIVRKHNEIKFDISRINDVVDFLIVKHEEFLSSLTEGGKYVSLELYARKKNVVISDNIRHIILSDLYEYEDYNRIDFFNLYRYPLEVFAVEAVDTVFTNNNLI